MVTTENLLLYPKKAIFEKPGLQTTAGQKKTPKVDMSITTTIAAIATPFGNGGIGIIRISGPDSFRIGETIFRKKDKTGPTAEKKTHILQYGHIVDRDTEETLDEVLVAFMKARKL